MNSLKRLLADAGRVLAHEGQGDYVAGHVSLRLPDQSGRFLMKPSGIGLDDPFALPARIREIQVERGQAIIVQ